MWEILLEVLLETLQVVPILYLVYLLVSYLGHNHNNKYAKVMSKTKKFGPLIGGIVGCIPQCGFSVVMADLYSKKSITIGTLIAVMVATSDEAIPLMLSKPEFIVPMLIMIAIKLGVAVLFGYIFDLAFRLFKKEQSVDAGMFNKIHNHDCDLTSCSTSHIIHCHNNEDEHCHDHTHKHKHKSCVDNIFLDALIHTLKITAFLFIVSLIIDIIVESVGLDGLANIFTQNKYVQPFLAGLIGLIPSCASSMALVELFMEGVINFGAMMAGLCAGSGIGLIVLFTRNKKRILENILILISLYLIGCLVGLVCTIVA